MAQREMYKNSFDEFGYGNEDEDRSDVEKSEAEKSDEEEHMKLDYGNSSDDEREQSNSLTFPEDISEHISIKAILDPVKAKTEKRLVGTTTKTAYTPATSREKEEKEEQRWDRYLRRSFIEDSDEDDEEDERLAYKQNLTSGSLEHLLTANKKKRKLQVSAPKSEPELSTTAKKPLYLTRNERLHGLYSLMPPDIAMLIFPFNVCTRDMPMSEPGKFQTAFLLQIVNPLTSFVINVIRNNIVVLIRRYTGRSSTRSTPEQDNKHIKMARLAASIVYYLDANEFKSRIYFTKIEENEIQKLSLTVQERQKIASSNILISDILGPDDKHRASRQ